MTIRTPRTTKAATELLERYAANEGAIAEIEARRNAGISAANAQADAAAEPLLQQRAAMAAKLGPWWQAAAAELTGGKRKSIELGGCVIGTRKGRASLEVAADELVTIAALNVKRWAKGLLRVKTTLNRAKILDALDGSHAEELLAMGLSRKEGEDVFFVDRVEQPGTLAGAAA